MSTEPLLPDRQQDTDYLWEDIDEDEPSFVEYTDYGIYHNNPELNYNGSRKTCLAGSESEMTLFAPLPVPTAGELSAITVPADAVVPLAAFQKKIEALDKSSTQDPRDIVYKDTLPAATLSILHTLYDYHKYEKYHNFVEAGELQEYKKSHNWDISLETKYSNKQYLWDDYNYIEPKGPALEHSKKYEYFITVQLFFNTKRFAHKAALLKDVEETSGAFILYKQNNFRGYLANHYRKMDDHWVRLMGTTPKQVRYAFECLRQVSASMALEGFKIIDRSPIFKGDGLTSTFSREIRANIDHLVERFKKVVRFDFMFQKIEKENMATRILKPPLGEFWMAPLYPENVSEYYKGKNPYTKENYKKIHTLVHKKQFNLFTRGVLPIGFQVVQHVEDECFLAQLMQGADKMLHAEYFMLYEGKWHHVMACRGPEETSM